MRIRLDGSYRGRPSKELEILPGEYDADDPRLFGLADYLVKNGHAVVVSPAEQPAQQDGEPLADRNQDADVWNKPNPPDKPIPASKRTKKVQ